MKEKKAQKSTWKTLGHADLRYLDQSLILPAEPMVAATDSAQKALTTLEYHLGFVALDVKSVVISTPIGEVRIERNQLSHIIEKRRDARERYVKHALACMKNPFEVWRVAYEIELGNDAYRYAYIAVFEDKTHMLVVFSDADGKVLWNFMQSDSKALNKHRHGECVYRRLAKP